MLQGVALLMQLTVQRSMLCQSLSMLCGIGSHICCLPVPCHAHVLLYSCIAITCATLE